MSAYKKNYDSADNVKVSINELTGQIKVFSVKTVVEAAQDSKMEISLEDTIKTIQNSRKELK